MFIWYPRVTLPSNSNFANKQQVSKKVYCTIHGTIQTSFIWKQNSSQNNSLTKWFLCWTQNIQWRLNNILCNSWHVMRYWSPSTKLPYPSPNGTPSTKTFWSPSTWRWKIWQCEYNAQMSYLIHLNRMNPNMDLNTQIQRLNNPIIRCKPNQLIAVTKWLSNVR